jgi:membrane-associated HD superfamily phosphohydrolase
MTRQIKLLLVFCVLVLLIVIVVVNRDSIIREHLENEEPAKPADVDEEGDDDEEEEDCCNKGGIDFSSPPKFQESLLKKFEKTDKNVNKIKKEFSKMNTKSKAQVAEAQSMKDKLSAAVKS